MAAKLQFKFKDMIDEINAIEKIAARFISPSSAHVLPQLKETLLGIQHNAQVGVSRDWGIKRESPLRTTSSAGHYEPGGKGSHQVYATISSIWEVAPLARPGKKAPDSGLLELTGKASSMVRIMDETDGTELAMWRMEVADAASPGCYFHVQILGESIDAPFPKSLPVPRLPMFLVTPMLAIEFAIGELFQDEWQPEIVRESDALRNWRAIHQHRLLKLLDWQKTNIAAMVSGSPWAMLKSLKPKSELFLGR